jgi:drug/metabolite transporter (DMT)-like permease
MRPMNENKNSDLSYQTTFIKLVLGSIICSVIAWVLSYRLVKPSADILSFLITAFIGYFYLPSLKKLGFLRWATIVILITGCFGAVYYGNSVFGESRVWAGFVLAILGILSFFSNWLYLWVMSNGLKVESKDDIMTPRTWLIWNGLGGVAMILLGLCVAFGVFE